MPAVVIVAIVLVIVLLGVVLVTRRSGGPTNLPGAAPAAVGAADGLRTRLGKTRRALGDRLNSLLRRGDLDSAFWSELEESLIAADMGVAAATRVAAGVKSRRPETGEGARAALCEELLALLADKDRSLDTTGAPALVLVVGVNGSGKTTTIAKLASLLKAEGNSVILGSADTFRAAADTQLRTWAARIDVPVVGGGGSTDPASVAYDAYQAAQARSADVLIIDTAGRLQAKTNLMEELAKVARILRREAGRIDEVLLVVDGTSGQNALSQARAFSEAVGVTGLVITKLDGSARGGVVVAVEEELGIPTKYIGVGEGLEHLITFDPAAYVDALVGE
jgi:fused signal recognition particle receptor